MGLSSQTSAERSLLICIDGTHDAWIAMSDTEYGMKFAGSHVRSIADKSVFGKDATIYIKGPNVLAGDAEDSLEKALNFIAVKTRGFPGGINLNFCGYSRGAALALDLANAFALPPDTLWQYLKRQVSYGKTTTMVERISATRRALDGRVRVGTLIMFDAVDMSFVIDGDEIAREIGSVAHVVRSSRWGSRNGWGNVGLELAEGTRPGFPPKEIDGTHAALGGLPATGDLPKPMVRAILKLPPSQVDWQDAERIYRGMVPCPPKLAACIGKPGLFLAPAARILVDAGAHSVLTEMLVLDEKGNSVIGRWLPKQLQNKRLEESLKSLLQDYRDDGGGWRGTRHCYLASKIRMKGAENAGAFESMGAFFARSPAAGKIIEAYREADRKASRKALATVKDIMRERFPAAI